MITLEVHEDTILSAPRLPLPNDDSWQHLLTKIRFTFLDGSHDHVTNTGGWETVETTLDTFDGDDVEILGSGVVSTVHGGCHWKTQ